MRDHKTLRNINTCAKSYRIITRLRKIEKGLNDRLHFNPSYDVPPMWITFLLKTNERTFVHVTLITSRKGFNVARIRRVGREQRKTRKSKSHIINLWILMIADKKLKTLLNANTTKVSHHWLDSFLERPMSSARDRYATRFDPFG